MLHFKTETINFVKALMLIGIASLADLSAEQGHWFFIFSCFLVIYYRLISKGSFSSYIRTLITIGLSFIYSKKFSTGRFI